MLLPFVQTTARLCMKQNINGSVCPNHKTLRNIKTKDGKWADWVTC